MRHVAMPMRWPMRRAAGRAQRPPSVPLTRLRTVRYGVRGTVLRRHTVRDGIPPIGLALRARFGVDVSQHDRLSGRLGASLVEIQGNLAGLEIYSFLTKATGPRSRSPGRRVESHARLVNTIFTDRGSGGI